MVRSEETVNCPRSANSLDAEGVNDDHDLTTDVYDDATQHLRDSIPIPSHTKIRGHLYGVRDHDSNGRTRKSRSIQMKNLQLRILRVDQENADLVWTTSRFGGSAQYS